MDVADVQPGKVDNIGPAAQGNDLVGREVVLLLLRAMVVSRDDDAVGWVENVREVASGGLCSLSVLYR